MTRNLYYRAIHRRENFIKNFILAFFSTFSSYPRLLLEVFLRKNFGERYFRLSSSIIVTVLLAALPLVPTDMLDYAESGISAPMSQYLTWYLFLVVFLFFSILRHREIRRNPSVFDFARYSLSNGKINPVFYSIQLPGIKTDNRLIETVLEPAPFFAAGIVLWLLHQKLGLLLTISSIFYGLCYVADYQQGDNFVMDKIDEIICNEELKKSFVDGASEEQTRGFRFVGRVPDDPDMRRQILPLMMEDEEIAVAR